MFCPEGYRAVAEVQTAALLAAEDSMNHEFANAQSRYAINFDSSPDEMAVYNSVVSELVGEAAHMAVDIVDEFLQQLPQIWICSPKGQVMKLAKSLIIPRAEYLLAESFHGSREEQYECLNTKFWTIDVKKLESILGEYEIKARKLAQSAQDGYAVVSSFAANGGAEILAPFHGWALCFPEQDFPSKKALEGLSKRFPATRKESQSVVQKIMELTEREYGNKATVKSQFPELSWRRFEHFWQLAAEKKPELSRPGRKS